jgi:hypothetical protein
MVLRRRMTDVPPDALRAWQAPRTRGTPRQTVSTRPIRRQSSEVERRTCSSFLPRHSRFGARSPLHEHRPSGGCPPAAWAPGGRLRPPSWESRAAAKPKRSDLPRAYASHPSRSAEIAPMRRHKKTQAGAGRRRPRVLGRATFTHLRRSTKARQRSDPHSTEGSHARKPRSEVALV